MRQRPKSVANYPEKNKNLRNYLPAKIWCISYVDEVAIYSIHIVRPMHNSVYIFVLHHSIKRGVWSTVLVPLSCQETIKTWGP